MSSVTRGDRESDKMVSGTRGLVRPLKLIAFVCCCVAVLVLGASLTTTYWLQGKGFHQGLWEYCHTDLRTKQERCGSTSDRLWIMACGILAVGSLLACLAAAVVSFVGLLSRTLSRKQTLYITAAVVLIVSAVCLLAAVIIFPVMLLRELEQFRSKYDITDWLFSWSYGLAWGAWLFMVGATVLLFVRGDQREADREEKGKSYYHANS